MHTPVQAPLACIYVQLYKACLFSGDLSACTHFTGGTACLYATLRTCTCGACLNNIVENTEGKGTAEGFVDYPGWHCHGNRCRWLRCQGDCQPLYLSAAPSMRFYTYIYGVMQYLVDHYHFMHDSIFSSLVIFFISLYY